MDDLIFGHVKAHCLVASRLQSNTDPTNDISSSLFTLPPIFVLCSNFTVDHFKFSLPQITDKNVKWYMAMIPVSMRYQLETEPLSDDFAICNYILGLITFSELLIHW